MKFNSYFAIIDHDEANFVGKLALDQECSSANFTKICDNLYIIHFKTQTALKYRMKIPFRSREHSVEILLPVLTKYNKRKQKKMSQLLLRGQELNASDFIAELIKIEKFLSLEKLIDFFSLDKSETLDNLLSLELQQKIKIIDISHLFITSYRNYEVLMDSLKNILIEAQQNKARGVTTSTLEDMLKIPQSSLFFKYLLSSLSEELGFKLHKEQVVFLKQGLTEKEREDMQAIEQTIRRNHLTLFSIDEIIKISGLPYQSVNSVLWAFLKEERIVQISEKHFIYREDLIKIINRLKKYKRNQGELIDIKSFREIFPLNRKNIIALLEYLDSRNITARQGNQRKIILAV